VGRAFSPKLTENFRKKLICLRPVLLLLLLLLLIIIIIIIIIIITGIGRPTSATPRDHGDSTSGNKDAEENDGDQLDDVTDDVRGVDVTSR